MSGADNHIEHEYGIGNGEMAENSFVYRGEVAPGSRRRQDFVLAYHSWVQFTADPEAARIYASRTE